MADVDVTRWGSIFSSIVKPDFTRRRFGHLTDEEIAGFFGREALSKDVSPIFRKESLKVHPDKNLDNEEATEVFKDLTELHDEAVGRVDKTLAQEGRGSIFASSEPSWADTRAAERREDFESSLKFDLKKFNETLKEYAMENSSLRDTPFHIRFLKDDQLAKVIGIEDAETMTAEIIEEKYSKMRSDIENDSKVCASDISLGAGMVMSLKKASAAIDATKTRLLEVLKEKESGVGVSQKEEVAKESASASVAAFDVKKLSLTDRILAAVKGILTSIKSIFTGKSASDSIPKKEEAVKESASASAASEAQKTNWTQRVLAAAKSKKSIVTGKPASEENKKLYAEWKKNPEDAAQTHADRVARGRSGTSNIRGGGLGG